MSIDATESPPQATVLVLDDEEPIRRAAKRILELYDYVVITAANAHEAVAAVDNDQVDLLVCDLVLPGLSGREAANMLLAHQPDMKVLYMSGFHSADSHRAKLEASGDPFLAKPFEVPDLVEAVEQALGNR